MGTSSNFIVTSKIKLIEGVKLQTVETFIFIFVLESCHDESYIRPIVRGDLMLLTFHMPPLDRGQGPFDIESSHSRQSVRASQFL